MTETNTIEFPTGVTSDEVIAGASNPEVIDCGQPDCCGKPDDCRKAPLREEGSMNPGQALEVNIDLMSKIHELRGRVIADAKPENLEGSGHDSRQRFKALEQLELAIMWLGADCDFINHLLAQRAGKEVQP